MVLYGASFIIFIFVSFSLFFRADCSLAAKIIGSLIVLAISLKYVIYQILGGAFFSPDLPRWFVIGMEALYGALIMLFFLLLLWDLYLFGNWLLAKAGMPIPKHLPTGWIKSGLVSLALLGGIWGTYESLKVPALKTVEVKLANLPSELENFCIVQLTDLHIGPLLKKDWLDQVVEIVNRQDADLIALTGDFIDGHVDQLGEEVEPLAKLRAKYGVVGITGNHEYYWNVTEWEDALKELGIDMLQNEHRAISINGQTLVVAGIPDLAALRFGFEGPNLEKALKDAPDAVKILLSHQPREAKNYLQQVDLQLSGHTHGGIMFFLQPLVAHYNAGFVQGLYAENAKALYVSPGTGLWNGFSSRVGVPSEITKIILETKTEQ